jgi:hypothetical protein
VPILANDPSLRPGWTTPYFKDGSGWTGMDEVMSREDGWHLFIDALGIAVREGTIPIDIFSPIPRGGSPTYTPHCEDEHFSRLLERAMSGSELAYKALYLMVYNDPRYEEYKQVVEALKDNYSN